MRVAVVLLALTTKGSHRNRGQRSRGQPTQAPQSLAQRRWIQECWDKYHRNEPLPPPPPAGAETCSEVYNGGSDCWDGIRRSMKRGCCCCRDMKEPENEEFAHLSPADRNMQAFLRAAYPDGGAPRPPVALHQSLAEGADAEEARRVPLLSDDSCSSGEMHTPRVAKANRGVTPDVLSEAELHQPTLKPSLKTSTAVRQLCYVSRSRRHMNQQLDDLEHADSRNLEGAPASSVRPPLRDRLKEGTVGAQASGSTSSSWREPLRKIRRHDAVAIQKRFEKLQKFHTKHFTDQRPVLLGDVLESCHPDFIPKTGLSWLPSYTQAGSIDNELLLYLQDLSRYECIAEEDIEVDGSSHGSFKK